MRILVYEYFTGGGLWSSADHDPRTHALLGEGSCMVRAICEDLANIPGNEVVQLCDSRLAECWKGVGPTILVRNADEELRELGAWSTRADGVLLIAPEHDGRLLTRCELVQRAGGRLLSPDSEFVRLAGDKRQVGLTLAAAGIGTPRAVVVPHAALRAWHTSRACGAAGVSLPQPPAYPAVVKPVDGAGSQDTYFVSDPERWEALAGQIVERSERTWLLEQFCEGMAVSAAVLCGPRDRLVLPPCAQRLSEDGRFTYLGGSYPLAPDLALRACQLARNVLRSLPRTTGYLGIDMVLGHDSRSPHDVVVDVNPRLTTSYVGLRRAATTNLAAAMLDIAHSRRRPLFFRNSRVEFESAG